MNDAEVCNKDLKVQLSDSTKRVQYVVDLISHNADYKPVIAQFAIDIAKHVIRQVCN